MFRATSCSSTGESIVSTQPLVYVTLCRLYWYNWFSWWWARDCSKHAENWNKYIEKNCTSSWPFTKNHNKMQGKQNIKFIILVLYLRICNIEQQMGRQNRFWTELVQAFHKCNMLLISSGIQLSIGHCRSQMSEICHILKGFTLSGTFMLRFYLAFSSQDTDVRI